MKRAVFVTLLLTCCGVALAAEPRVVVDEGKTDYQIVCPADATKVARLAAKELQDLVLRATGVQVPIVAEPGAERSHLFIGLNRHSAAAGVVPEGLRPEGFRLKTVGRDVHVVGVDVVRGSMEPTRSSATQCGTLSGVYELVERCLGVRFYWHDDLGTVVPATKRMTVPDLDFHDAPVWTYRALPYSPSGATDGMFGRRLRLGHSYTVSHSHAWHSILPVEKYGREHPEYFAEIDGRRQAKYYSEHHGGQVCTTNPEVIEIFARSAIEFFRQHPDRDMFSVSPNDGGGFCTCSRCRALDPPVADGAKEPQMTDRLLTFYNAVAERLVKTHPDKLLGAYIYSFYKEPPRKVRPHANLYLVHATNTAFMQGFQWPVEQAWEKQWMTLTGRLCKYDIYYRGPASLQLMAPVTSHLAEKIRAESEAGIRGGYLYVGQSYEQLGAGHYLLARLMWNPRLDVKALEREYYDTLYGPAGETVRTYYELLEERLRTVHLQGIDVTDPAVAQALRTRQGPGSHGYILAAYSHIIGRTAQLVLQAQRQRMSLDQRKRLDRFLDQHDLLTSTVLGMLTAGRLQSSADCRPEDAAALVELVSRREVARTSVKEYAPALDTSLNEADSQELSALAPRGPLVEFARAWSAPDRPDNPVAYFTYGTFEDLPAGDFADRLRFHAEAAGSVALSDGDAYRGRRAALVTLSGPGQASMTLSAAVKPETCYRLLLAYRNHCTAEHDPATIAPRTRLIWRDERGKAVTSTREYLWGGALAHDQPDTWRQLPILLKTPPGTRRIDLTLFFPLPGRYEIDEVRLEELGSPQKTAQK